MAVREYELRLKLTAPDDGANKGLKDTEKGLGNLKTAAVGMAAAWATIKTAQAAIDFARVGANVKATEQRFVAFAGGTERAAKFLGAFEKATDGAVDRMSAMAGGARLLQMGLVANADEMEVMAGIATKLGDQTMAAGDRLGDFAALLANKSIPRLDNFGIASGKVREEVNRLKKAGVDADEAFKLAVIKEGTKSLKILGDTSDSAANKIAIMDAQWKNAKNSASSLWASVLVGTGAIDGLNDVMTELAENVEGLEKGEGVVHKAVAIPPGNIKAARELRKAHQELLGSKPQWDQYQKAISGVTQAQDDAAFAAVELRRQDELLALNLGDSSEAFNQYQAAIEGAQAVIDASPTSYQLLVEAENELTASTQAATLSQLGLSEQLKDASSAQIAQAAITELKTQLDAGKLTFDEYKTAVSETQLAFGLTTPKSIALAEGIQALAADLAAGKLDASAFNEQLTALKISIDQIPTSKTVDIRINVRRTGFGGSLPGGLDPTQEDLGLPTGDTTAAGPMFGSGPGFANGTNMIVPPGFNENFRFRASSGERVIVIPREQVTNNNFNLTRTSTSAPPRESEDFNIMQEMAA